MSRVDHTEKNGESGLLDIVGVFDTIDGGGPVRAKCHDLIGLHDWIRSVEPPVADERKEEEGRFAKLERLVVLVNVADTADEGGFGGIEEFEGLDSGGAGGVGERAKSVLDRFVLVFTALSGQLEVIIQEIEDVFRFLNPWQEFVPFVGAVHSETSGTPFLVFGVGVGDGGVHDDVEEVITFGGDIILGKGRNEFHSFKSVVDLLGGGGGVLDRLHELVVDPTDLLVLFVTGIELVSRNSRGRKWWVAYLLSMTSRSSMCNFIPRRRPMMKRQSVTMGAGGGGSSPREWRTKSLTSSFKLSPFLMRSQAR